jgi:hypothetical protein
MELLDEEADDLRSQLLRKSVEQRKEIEGDVKFISEETQRIITNALVIGGSLAAAYFLVRQLSGSSKKRKSKRKTQTVKLVQGQNPDVVSVEEESSPGILGTVGAAIATQASVFLLNLAKEKLMEYLQAVTEKKTEDK